MNRFRLIGIAALLAIGCAILPLSAMLYLSWTRAISEEQARLQIYAQRAILRANISLNEIGTALRALEPLSYRPCSEEHIARMRQLTVNNRSIEEIGYFQKGQLQCTSWGRTQLHSAQTPIDFTTRDGLQVTQRMLPTVTQGDPMLAFHYRSHNVLAMPSRFADVIVEPGIQLATATDDGHLLGELNGPDALMVRDIIANPVNSIDDNWLVAVAHGNGLIAIALEPRDYIYKRLRQEQLILLPIGALIAALIIALAIWAVRRRLSPLGELTLAVRKREFVVHYQPIVELANGHCIGAEALVRWQRPDGSMVRPDLFIPLAEESGLILPITDQVIDNVVRDLAPLLMTDRNLHIAINLSAADIKSARVLKVINEALTGTGIGPNQIWLEATERGFIDVNSARATLDRARESGHAVAIDDFGTGYSSLAYLQSLPLDALKIDKSFVDTIGTDAATSSVTPHIIDMAKALGLKIVAEGVETQQQADYLRSHAVDFAQGWLYAKAMPAADFIAYCRQHNKLEQDPSPPAADIIMPPPT